MSAYEFAYSMNDHVIVEPLEVRGRVIGLYVCEDGIQYRIRYFYDGNVRTEYFMKDELRTGRQ